MVVEVIKYEPSSPAANEEIIHKFGEEDFSCKAQLLVAPSQVALFVNEGEIHPFLPGHYTLDESNNSMWGFVNKWRNRLSGGVSSFHCVVYFVNMVYLNDLKFGTSNPIQMQDADEGVNVHVRAAGLFGAHINNDDKDGKDVIKFFQKVVGTRETYSKDELANYLRGKIVERVSDTLGKTMILKNIGILKVSAYYQELSDSLKEQMIPFFADYGIKIDNFSFMSINVPDEDIQAINEAKIAARKMDMESAAMARKREREGYTYQQEKGFEVLGTAAGNESTMGGGMMNAGMGLGMGFGLGGAFGGAMNNMAQNAFGSMNANPQQQPQQQPQATDMQKCSSCGATVKQGVKFCPECGAKLGSFCPKCGAPISPNAKFCGECGAKLQATCPNCGAELPQGTKFCPECGTKCE